MKFILKIFFVLLTFTGFGQTNLVPNSSFEELDVIHPNSPSGPGQLDHAKHWKLIGTDPATNTADLNSDVSGKFKFGGSPATAHTGHNFIGFGGCEGGQVKLTQKLQPMHWVTVSFWFAPEEAFDKTIAVYLRNEKLDNINCDTHEVPYEIYMEAKIDADNPWGNPPSPHFPGNWYYYKSEPFLVTTDDIEWLLIKQLDKYGTVVFVDDIVVNTFEYCEHVCAAEGNIEFTNIIPTGMVGNSGVNFFTTVKNATEVEMFVWDRWGNLGYYWHSFDPLGLVDPGYSDFAIVWNGHSTLTGGDFIASSTYPIRLIVRSCSDEFQYDGAITILGINNPPAVLYQETQIMESPNCCPEYAIIQNTIYNGTSGVYVNDFIHAGSNIAPPPYGPVIVNNTGNVNYRAGNYILLEPGGFWVNPGGVFEAKIESCGASSERLQIGSRGHYEELRSNTSESELSLIKSGISPETDTFGEDEINIFPNPTNGILHINLKTFSDVNYELYSLDGRLILKNELENINEFQIDLSSNESGVYFLKLNCNGALMTKRIIKK